MDITLWGLPVRTSPYVRRGLVELRRRGELVGQVWNPWGIDFTSMWDPGLGLKVYWHENRHIRETINEIWKEIHESRKRGVEPDLLLQHEPEEEEKKVDRKTVKLQYEDGSTDTLKGVTGIEIMDDLTYYVLVMFSEDERHKLYKYACDVWPKLLVGDVVSASVNKAPASVRAVTDSGHGARPGSAIHNCDVLWRKHRDD